MKYWTILIPFLFALGESSAQSNNDEYNKLLKTTKKPNIPHFKFDLGIGVGSMDNFVKRSDTKFYKTPPEYSVDSSFESTTLFYLQGSVDIDAIETKRVYVNLGGAYTFGFWPNVKSKNVAGVEDSKESEKLSHYEAHLKLGYGGESFKVYVMGGIEHYSFKHTYYLKSTLDDGVNPPLHTEDWDTGYVKQTYPKIGLGIRIGNNRQKFSFDLNVYKLLPGDEFFNWTQKPNIGKEIGSFGTYESIYPSLPIGLSMSLQRHGKYEVKVDYRKIRERDYYAKNAHSFMVTFSKQFDFYNKKKK